MASQSYSIRNSWGLGGGLIVIDAIITNVSSGDTINFTNDLTKIQGLATLNPTNTTPGIVSYTASTYASSGIVTLPSSASFAGDNMDLLVTGPAVGTVIPGGPLQ